MQCSLSCLYGLLPLPVDRENKIPEIGLGSEETPACDGKPWWAEICLSWLILLWQKWVWSEGEKAQVKFTTTGNRLSYFS